jgi:hypothetical protein
MKVKQYIVTYNNSTQINNCLESIFTNLSAHELSFLEIYIINNHTNFHLRDEFVNRVTVLHNVLRPDFSTGHLSRNWNQAIINGFVDLNNPACDIVVTNQDDTIFKQNYIYRLIEHHTKFDFIQLGHGDNFVSYTPRGIKQIGLWDERFCNIGYQEADYLLRAFIYHSERASINDFMHTRVYNEIDNNVIEIIKTGWQRFEPYHAESSQYHNISKGIFIEKWGFHPSKDDGAAIEFTFDDNMKSKKPLLPNFIYYPYFEKNIETLKEQNYII